MWTSNIKTPSLVLVHQTVTLRGTRLAFEHFHPDQAWSVWETETQASLSWWSCWLEHSLGKGLLWGWRCEILASHTVQAYGGRRYSHLFWACFKHRLVSWETRFSGQQSLALWAKEPLSFYNQLDRWRKLGSVVTNEPFLQTWRGRCARTYISLWFWLPHGILAVWKSSGGWLAAQEVPAWDDGRPLVKVQSWKNVWFTCWLLLQATECLDH